MNFKLDGLKLLNADIVTPEIVYARFSEELNYDEVERIVATLNHGHEMLMAYKFRREGLAIDTINEFINYLDRIHQRYSNEIFTINRYSISRRVHESKANQR